MHIASLLWNTESYPLEPCEYDASCILVRCFGQAGQKYNRRAILILSFTCTCTPCAFTCRGMHTIDNTSVHSSIPTSPTLFGEECRIPHIRD